MLSSRYNQQMEQNNKMDWELLIIIVIPHTIFWQFGIYIIIEKQWTYITLNLVENSLHLS